MAGKQPVSEEMVWNNYVLSEVVGDGHMTSRSAALNQHSCDVRFPSLEVSKASELPRPVITTGFKEGLTNHEAARSSLAPYKETLNTKIMHAQPRWSSSDVCFLVGQVRAKFCSHMLFFIQYSFTAPK